jgi:multidrug efflux pump subunit AcrA (membrane-fusion protein)
MANSSTRGLLAMFATALLGICSACSSEPKDTEQPVPVQIVPVSQSTLDETVTANAVLFPIAQSALVPKLSAPVKRFYVNRGSHVRAGQLLAELENRDLAAAAQENRGAFDQAQASYATATAADIPQELQKAQLDAQAAKESFVAAQKVYDSRKQLFEQGALPRKELDQAGVDLTNARNQYEIAQKRLESLNSIGAQQAQKSAKGQLESAEGKYQGAEAQLSYSQIRSPIHGVVTDRPLYPGEMASAGTPLLTVMDISQVVARAHIPQQSAALLKVGDPAEVTVPGFDNSFPGKVTIVSPALDPGSTTVEVWVTLKNPGERLKPGASVQISAVARSIKGALTIPAIALLTAQDGTTSVMVAGNDGRAHQKQVKTGVREADQVQIVDGLHAGDRVVGSGSYGLPDNRKITEAKAEQSKND